MEKLNKSRTQTFIASLISGSIVVIAFFSMFIEPMGAFGLFIIGTFAVGFTTSTFLKQYKKEYKSYIVSDVLNKLFDVECYNPTEGFSKDFVSSTHLIPVGNRYTSDDYVKAKYKGIEFERSDVCMQNVQSTGKSTTTVTYFQGSWSIFPFNKNISTFLTVKEKQFLSNSKPGGLFTDAPKTTKVLFEDIDFNEKFVVFAENEHDAFYVLTPHFIEKIKEIEPKFEGRLILGFVDHKLHVLLYNYKNILEPSLSKNITEQDYLKIENDLQEVIDIMKAFELIE